MKINEIFPDKTLAKLINNFLQKSNFGTSESDLLKIRKITYDGKDREKIENLEGLQLLKNLHTLIIPNNNVDNINALSNLNKIDNLELQDNKIENLEPLGNLTKVFILNLSNNNIKNVTPLENLTKLTHLLLSENNIQDISPLGKLTNLTNLRLKENPIENVSIVKKLTNLDCLNFSHTNVTEFPELFKSKIISLTLPKVKNLSNLSNIKRLRVLTLSSECNFTTLPLLENVSELIIYDANHEAKKLNNTISASSSLSNIEKLNGFINCVDKLDDYSFLNNLPNLRSLRFEVRHKDAKSEFEQYYAKLSRESAQIRNKKYTTYQNTNSI